MILGAPCMTGVRAWSALPAVSQTHFQWGLDSQGFPLSPILFLTFMDRISGGRDQKGSNLGTKWYHLCFLHIMLSSWFEPRGHDFLASSNQDLWHVLKWSTAAGMKISASRVNGSWLKRPACSPQVGGEVLPPVGEFRDHRVLFNSDGKMEHEIDRWINAASTVMWLGYWSKCWVQRGSSQFIGQSLPLSAMMMNFGSWPKGLDLGFKYPKRVPSPELWGTPSETEKELSPPGGAQSRAAAPPHREVLSIWDREVQPL